MDSKIVELREIKENRNNPRKITNENLLLLVRSILSFPKMLELRPLVVDDKYTIIGGNMRHKALNVIAKMSHEEIEKEIRNIPYVRGTEAETHVLIDFWQKWTANPVVSITHVDELEPDERKQFIVKDNVNYGEWDEALLQGFDRSLLSELNVMEWEEEAKTPASSEVIEDKLQSQDDRKRIIIIFSSEESEKVKDVFGFTPEKNRHSYLIEELLNIRQ